MKCTFILHFRVMNCRVHTRRQSLLARLEAPLELTFLEVRVGWSVIVAGFQGYRETIILIYVMSFSEMRRNHRGQNDEEGEGTCEATPCGQFDKCNLQSFVYLRSLLLGLVTF
jgi:hypothetical protein